MVIELRGRWRVLRRAAVSAVVAGTLLAGAGSALGATYGPQQWNYDTSSGRYRSNAGYHYISASSCGTTSYKSIELRVDKINASDPSVGTKSVRCGGSSVAYYSGISSYYSAYRGHFMQNKSAGWYGTLTDRNP
ncbi:MAG: hypothetical protein ACR2KK_18890 [Acidimicrobiales bacterium]